MPFLWSVLLAVLQATPSAAASVTVAARPDPIFIEVGEAGQQHLNFDLILKNETGEKLLINKIELSVLDAGGRLARREFYDEYGRTSLELGLTPAIEKGSSVLLYNPFHTFPSGTPLERLHYELSFSSENRERYFRSELDVAPVRYEPKTDLILPLRGRVLVWDGHDYNSHHRRFDYTQPIFVRHGNRTNFQRYGYDFVIVDEKGSIHRGRPRVNDDWYRARPDTMADYYGFGAPIYAAGAGRVVAVQDTKPDDRKFDPAELAKDERAYAGNYVVIDHGNGEFSWFGHIRQGSSRVRAGQRVRQGDVIAAVGASGSSLFPHLHYELRNGPGAREVEGLPSYFSRFRRILGARSVDVRRGAVNTGDLVDWQSTPKGGR